MLQGARKKVQAHWLEVSQRVESLVGTRRRKSPLSATESRILEDLQTEGVHVTRIQDLLPGGASAVLDCLSGIRDLLQEEPGRVAPAIWSRGASSTDLAADVLLTRLPQLYLLGLHPAILHLVERYLKLPVAYHGAVLRHSLVDRNSAGPRLWHKDAEDFHVFRMVIYLNDVVVGGGPFEYVPRHLGVSYKQFADPEAPVTDARMAEVVPPTQWKRCFGPAGTVILADTAQVFHHESIQTDADRMVLMVGYSSRRPSCMELAMAHFPAERVRPLLEQMLSPQHYSHVFSWRQAKVAA